MAMTYATISGRVTQPGTDLGIRARVTAVAMTTANALKFTDDDRITWGPQTAETNSAGFLGSLKVPTNHGIPGLFWKLTVEPIDRIPGLPRKWDFGLFEITASTRLEDLIQVDVTVVSGDVLVNVADMLADTLAAKNAAAASQAAAASSASNASGWATAAASSAADSDSSADLAAASGSTAAAAATTATTKAGEAAGSATSAAGSATTATTKAGEAATSATAAATARTGAETARTGAETAQAAAEDAQAAAEAVGATTDAQVGSSLAGRGLPTSGTELSASYEHKVDRAGATTGQVPTLQGDGSLAFEDGGGTAPVSSVNGQTGAVVLTQDNIGDGTTNKAYTATEKTKLAGVATGATANRSDAATDTLLNAKAPLASPAFTGTPTGITKTHVGLGNVDNTSDANKPVSTATQTALNLKANASALGDAAAKNTGTTAGTVAAGDDSRITGAAQKSANLSDLANATTARTNLALGSAATAAAGDFAGATNGAGEKWTTLSATTGTATGDCSAASTFTVTPTGNVTLAFSNVPAADSRTRLYTVIVTQGATVRTVTPPTGTKWMGAPAPTQVANKACVFNFLTVNGGTTWYASAAVEQ